MFRNIYLLLSLLISPGFALNLLEEENLESRTFEQLADRTIFVASPMDQFDGEEIEFLVDDSIGIISEVIREQDAFRAYYRFITFLPEQDIQTQNNGLVHIGKNQVIVDESSGETQFFKVQKYVQFYSLNEIRDAYDTVFREKNYQISVPRRDREINFQHGDVVLDTFLNLGERKLVRFSVKRSFVFDEERQCIMTVGAKRLGNDNEQTLDASIAIAQLDQVAISARACTIRISLDDRGPKTPRSPREEKLKREVKLNEFAKKESRKKRRSGNFIVFSQLDCRKNKKRKESLSEDASVKLNGRRGVSLLPIDEINRKKKLDLLMSERVQEDTITESNPGKMRQLQRALSRVSLLSPRKKKEEAENCQFELRMRHSGDIEYRIKSGDWSEWKMQSDGKSTVPLDVKPYLENILRAL